MIDTATIFGRALFAVRSAAGLKQSELARVVGLKRSAVTHLETGRTTPTFYSLMRLGDRLRKNGVLADPTTLIQLVHETARELNRRGVRVVNRPLRPEEEIRRTPTDAIDRIVARIYDEWLQDEADIEQDDTYEDDE